MEMDDEQQLSPPDNEDDFDAPLQLLPEGRIFLERTQTLSLGGLSSLILEKYREPLLKTIEDASVLLGQIMYGASRVLLHYTTKILEQGATFSKTGIHEKSANPRDIIITQELVEWSMIPFKKTSHYSNKRDTHDAMAALRVSAEAIQCPDFESLDCTHLNFNMKSMARSWSVECSNHLFYPWAQHMAMYLIAKHRLFMMSKGAARTLAKAIGRSHNYNTKRTKPIKYPNEREAHKGYFCGTEVELPAISAADWQQIVKEELALIPLGDSQLELLGQKFKWLRTIEEQTTEKIKFKSFTLLPLAHHGRKFLHIGRDNWNELLRRAGLETCASQKDAPATVISKYLNGNRLRRILREAVEGKPQRQSPLYVANEFLCTDGVEAQIKCGPTVLLKRPKRKKKRGREAINMDDAAAEKPKRPRKKRTIGRQHAEEESGAAAAEEEGQDPEAENDEENCDNEDLRDPIPMVQKPGKLYAVDPGVCNVITMGHAITGTKSKEVSIPIPPTTSMAMTGGGETVAFETVYKLSRRDYAEKCGWNHRDRHRKKIIAKTPDLKAEYENALEQDQDATAKTTTSAELRSNLQTQMRNFKAINRVSGCRKIARLRFHVRMRTQVTLDEIGKMVLPPNDPIRIVAWGGARWAQGMRGCGSTSAFKIYRFLRRLPRAKTMDGKSRIPREDEYCSSCKCSSCLGLEKMKHPRHQRVRKTVWIKDENGHSKKSHTFEQGQVYGIYQCAAKGCYRTHSRDRNGFSNIWRSSWERMHGRERPETLRREASHRLADVPEQSG